MEQLLGSGVVIDDSGYIVTNEHVISRATVIKVKLSDDSLYNATVVSSDPLEDIAILKIDLPTPLPFILLCKAPQPSMV